MSILQKLIVFTALLFAGILSTNAQSILLKNGNSITPKVALSTMLDSVYALKTSRFEMVSRERIDGEMNQNRAKGYVNYHPKKVFLRGLHEDGELANEIIYLEGSNNNNALVSPNGFPYINLNLDPLGSTMRHNRHLTILEAGGQYLADMLRIGMRYYKKNNDSTQRFFIERESEGLLKLTISNPDYTYINYTVLPNEQVRDLCFRLGIPEYKLVEINEEVDDFYDLSEGQTIKIPNYYTKKFELIIREKDFIPVHVKAYDDLGLYAEYEYLYFDCNVKVDDQTFNSETPAYTF